jgi:hypothetical protein
MQQAMKSKAIERFRWRRANPLTLTINQRVVPKDNADAPAGAPMVYFCVHCGWPTAILDEEYFLSRPVDICPECLGMHQHGWLEEAKK